MYIVSIHFLHLTRELAKASHLVNIHFLHLTWELAMHIVGIYSLYMGTCYWYILYIFTHYTVQGNLILL